MFENLFSKQGLSLDRLRALVEVAEAGSITAAVHGDAVRQSQYSRQLKELEQHFQCEITRRDGKRLSLTAEGHRLAGLAREHLQALSLFGSETRNEKITVCIGAGGGAIHWLLIPRLLEAGYPALVFRFLNLRTAEAIRKLRDGELHFAVVRGKSVVSKPLQSAKLGVVEYGLFVPSCLIRAKEQGLGEILASLPLAILEGGSRISVGLVELSTKLGVQSLSTHECSGLTQIARAIATHRVAGVLPLLAKEEMQAYQVQVFPLGKHHPNFRDELVLAWNPRTISLSSRLEKLVKELQQKLAVGGAVSPTVH